MRKLGNFIYFIFISFLFCSCSNKKKFPGVQIKKLDYPSASSIEYFDEKLYVMGDDATNLLVLDTNLNIIDSIQLLSYSGKRIPKEIKPDFESSAFYRDNKGTVLFLFGSGSLFPYRNSALWYYFETKIKDTISLEPLYSQIKNSGINEVNIEGVAFIAGKLILVNRGNKGHPENHLIITDQKFWDNDSSFQISIIPFEAQKDTASFKGISGLCYVKKSDQLIMTVSTEDTRDTYTDGAIGKSYLWIINSFSNKLNSKTIGADKIIDLEEIDPRFKNQKIESATVIGETSKLINIVLVADNDDGSSTIFKMSITKD